MLIVVFCLGAAAGVVATLQGIAILELCRTVLGWRADDMAANEQRVHAKQHDRE